MKNSAPKIDLKRQFHFLHGDDEAAIDTYKIAVVHAHLTPEEREENYREIIPTGSPAQLKKVIGDVLSELSTVSFLPDAKRVVALYTVSDFFDAKGAAGRGTKAKKAASETDGPKKTASDHLTEFIERELPHLPAVLIVIVHEDYEKWKRVATANPVVALAANTGALRAFKEESPQYAFFDALFERDTGKALSLWRQWLDKTGGGSPRPYIALASQLRLLIQAKTAAGGQLSQRGITRQKFATDFLPAEVDRNVFSLRPEWRHEKMTRASGNFSFSELLGAYERLEPLQRFAIPLNSDPYVPDRRLLAELWITEFTAARRS